MVILMSQCITTSCIKLLSGRTRRVIVIKCPYQDPDLSRNYICRGKLILKLSLLKASDIALDAIGIGKNYFFRYNSSAIKMLHDYAIKLSRIKKLMLRESLKSGSLQCLFSRPCHDDCALLKNILRFRNCFIFLNDIGLAYTNPLGFYKVIKSMLFELKDFKSRKEVRRCAKLFQSILTRSLSLLEESLLLTYYDQ